MPTPRVTWQRGSSQIRVPSGQTITYPIYYSSTVDIEDLELRSSRNNYVTVDHSPSIFAGEEELAEITIAAPFTSKKRSASVTIAPFDGTKMLSSPLSLRIEIQPLTFTWSQPQVQEEIEYNGDPIEITVQVTATYPNGVDCRSTPDADPEPCLIEGVEFMTRDIGLAPIISPDGPIDMIQGVPEDVTFELNGVYAPSSYFVTIVPQVNRAILANPLRVRVTIRDIFGAARSKRP